MVVFAVTVGAVDDLFDGSCVQQNEIILNAMNIKRKSIVAMMPMKYGVESGELATIKLSAKEIKKNATQLIISK